jgi:anti-anti-sigma regulatory factor
MLRITADEKPRVLSFRLEGRLEGPWVGELEKCWRGMVARAGTPALRVDLSGVTFVDAAGKAQLTAMHRQGAEFTADDCLTSAIVAEIIDEGLEGVISTNKVSD